MKLTIVFAILKKLFIIIKNQNNFQIMPNNEMKAAKMAIHPP